MRSRGMSGAVAFCMFVITAAAFAGAEDTIPPEILAQFDDEVLTGARPKVVAISQKDIFSLRDNPQFECDLVTFDFNYTQLSKVQTDIVQKWVAHGSKPVWLRGRAALQLGVLGMRTHYDLHDRPLTNIQDTSCGTDVRPDLVHIDGYRYRSGRSTYDDAYVYCRKGEGLPVVAAGAVSDKIACGMVRFGNGRVYYSPVGFTGPDSDRFRLNFYHWMLGLPVPNPARTSVGNVVVVNLEMLSKLDRILLTNGDSIIGVVLSDVIVLQSEQKKQFFEIGQIAKVVLAGDDKPDDTVVLGSGKPVKGRLSQDSFQIYTNEKRTLHVPRGMVKEIVLQAERSGIRRAPTIRLVTCRLKAVKVAEGTVVAETSGDCRQGDEAELCAQLAKDMRAKLGTVGKMDEMQSFVCSLRNGDESPAGLIAAQELQEGLFEACSAIPDWHVAKMLDLRDKARETELDSPELVKNAEVVKAAKGAQVLILGNVSVREEIDYDFVAEGAEKDNEKDKK